MSSSRGAAKRLIKELDTWRSESAEEKGIERLGPIDESDLLTWEAVINGVGVGGGYDGALLPLPFILYMEKALIIFIQKRDDGSSQSSSHQHTRMRRPRSAFSRPLFTPISTSTQAKFAWTC